MLVPLSDLAADSVVAGMDATVAELLCRLESPRGVYPFDNGDILIQPPVEDCQPPAV